MIFPICKKGIGTIDTHQVCNLDVDSIHYEYIFLETFIFKFKKKGMLKMQENLRLKLIELKEKEGISYIYIARNIDISKTTISLFIKGERNLSKAIEERLIKFLKKYS